MTDTAPEYIIAHLREALAHDDRTNVLDIGLHIDEGTLFLTGRVESEQQRESIEAVVRETAPEGIALVNKIQLATYGPPETESVS
ncbi:MAG TPA: BON domain-containing protein [Vicinamibacteria bacterium]|nr:BON domain-containing protein [Vicinamibacteria bacterium]